MKRDLLFLALAFVITACNTDKKEHSLTTEEIVTSESNDSSNQHDSSQKESENGIDWETIPDLKAMGDFPFITAPRGLTIELEENGMTQVLEYAELVSYLGQNKLYTSEGKLGMIFMEFTDSSYSNAYFDKNILAYLDQMGAKKLYHGEIVGDDATKEQLKKNMFNGKRRMAGTNFSDPLTIYAFKNQGKKYILHIQSNSSIGAIFIMELNDFEPTIQTYVAKEMAADIDKTGKAILHIQFDSDKAILKPEAIETAQEIAVLLNTNPDLKLAIEGHTDNTGSASRNEQLSKQRAQALVDYLMKNGVAASRLKANGFGANKPLKPNDSEANKAQNRRVELVKLNE